MISWRVRLGKGKGVRGKEIQNILALARTNKEARETLEQWEAQHRAKVERILKEKGFIE